MEGRGREGGEGEGGEGKKVRRVDERRREEEKVRGENLLTGISFSSATLNASRYP